MDGWNISFLLGWPIFRCYVSFRECTFLNRFFLERFGWCIVSQLIQLYDFRGVKTSEYCWLKKSGEPFEVGSLSNFLGGFKTHSTWSVWDFWTINNITSPKAPSLVSNAAKQREALEKRPKVWTSQSLDACRCWDADPNYHCNWQKEPQPQRGRMPHCAKWQKFGKKKTCISRGRKNHLDFILHNPISI